MVTRRDVVGKLKNYLHHQISLAELVDWAEDAMREEEFEEPDFEELRDVVSRPYSGMCNPSSRAAAESRTSKQWKVTMRPAFSCKAKPDAR